MCSMRRNVRATALQKRKRQALCGEVPAELLRRACLSAPHVKDSRRCQQYHINHILDLLNNSLRGFARHSDDPGEEKSTSDNLLSIISAIEDKPISAGRFRAGSDASNSLCCQPLMYSAEEYTPCAHRALYEPPLIFLVT